MEIRITSTSPFHGDSFLLDPKNLGLNVLELHYVMLANYDQNV